MGGEGACGALVLVGGARCHGRADVRFWWDPEGDVAWMNGVEGVLVPLDSLELGCEGVGEGGLGGRIAGGT